MVHSLAACIFSLMYRTAKTDTSTPSTSTAIILPIEDGFYCSICATIMRSNLNVITIDLKPEGLVVNRCPLPIEVVERLNRVDSDENRSSRVIHLGSCAVGVLTHKEVINY